jgi:hypothetical protein
MSTQKLQIVTFSENGEKLLVKGPDFIMSRRHAEEWIELKKNNTHGTYGLSAGLLYPKGLFIEKAN